MKINDNLKNFSEADSIFVNQIVYDLQRLGRDIITLSLGEAFFDLPLFDFTKLDLTKSFHYSDSRGTPELRKKITDFYKYKHNLTINHNSEILISAGSKCLLFMTLLALANKSDEIVVFEPAWLSYYGQAKLLGLKVVSVPFGKKINELEDKFFKKAKMIILNNPNNPGGFVYSKKEILEIYDICVKNNLWLIVDEAYSEFVHKNNFFSALALSKKFKNIIVINSLSKNFGISGWRIGYIISNEKFINLILKVNQHIITCAPTILLQYCSEYFDDLVCITSEQISKLSTKRLEVKKMMNELNLEYVEGDSTFYFFLDISTFSGSSKDFCLNLLLCDSISVVPGSAYGKSTDNYIRISIGTESEERIYQALVIIKKNLTIKVDKKLVKRKLLSIDNKIKEVRM
tara:strand:- start:8 stop:1213 length:1206 start_codon:yes stop_codon:yes gene_type:complete